MERRSQARYEVCLEGEIIWGGGKRRQRCVIRDISLNGARVDTQHFVDVPDRFFLHEKTDDGLFECDLKWHQGGMMGVFFIDVGSQSQRRALIKQHARSA